MLKFVSLSVLSALLLASCQMRNTPSVAPQTPSPLQTKDDNSPSLSSLGSFVISIGENTDGLSAESLTPVPMPATPIVLSAVSGTTKFFDQGKYRYFSMVVRASGLPVTVDPNSVIFIPVAGGGISDTPFTEMKTTSGDPVDPKIQENIVPMGGSMNSKAVWPVKGVPKLILDPWPNLQVFPASEVASVAPVGKVAFPVGFAGKRVAARTADIQLNFAVPKSMDASKDLASMKIQGVLVTETGVKTVSESREERTENYNKGTSSVDTSTMITRLKQIKVGLVPPLRVTTFAGSTLDIPGVVGDPVSSMYSVCYNPTGLSLKNNYAVSSMDGNLHGSTFYSMKPSVAELAGLQSAIKVALPCGGITDAMQPFKQMVVQDFQRGQRLDTVQFLQDPLVGWSYGEPGGIASYMPGSEVEVTMTDPKFARSFVGRFRVGSGKEDTQGFVGAQSFVAGGSSNTAAIASAETVVADINGDSIPDVVRPNIDIDKKTVDVLLGKGDGSFNAVPVSGISIDFDAKARNVVTVGNFDKDSNPDAMVFGFNTVKFYTGNGNGTFTLKQTINLPSGYTAADAVAVDLNTAIPGMDVVVVSNKPMSDPNFTFLFNDGLGKFSQSDQTAQLDMGSIKTVNSLAVGDFGYISVPPVPADGRPDLVFTNGQRIYLWPSPASGIPFTDLSVRRVTVPAMDIQVGKFNGDPMDDIAFVTTPGIARVLTKGSSLAFSFALSPDLSLGTGSNATDIEVLDADNDNKLDIISSVFSFGVDTNSAGFLKGDGVGGFTLNALVTPGGLQNALFKEVTMADLNGDAHLDLLASTPGQVNVFLGNAIGTAFEFPKTKLLMANKNYPQVVAADMNADGFLDAVAINQTDGTVEVYLGNGSGGFGAALTAAATDPRSVAVGDLDHDGDVDAVVVGPDVIRSFKNNGTGQLVAVMTDFATATGAESRYVALGDLNGDGNLDAAVANNGTFNVSVLLGKGDGTFGAAKNFTLHANGRPEQLALGDVNGDYRLDMVVPEINLGGSDNIAVLLGRGDGTFDDSASMKMISLRGGNNPNYVAVADFNKDGKLDIAAAGGGQEISIFTGQGMGMFSAPQKIQLTSLPVGKDMVVGDVDGNGYLDLVFPSKFKLNFDHVGVLYGKATGFSKFQEFTSLQMGSSYNIRSVVLGDFDASDTKNKLDILGVYAIDAVESGLQVFTKK